MQNLILTSTGFANKNIKDKFLELLTLPTNKIKAIFIPTAAITDEAKVFIPVCKNDLLDLGILDENIYIYDLDKTMNCDEICNYNVIYVCGGTTTYLLEKMNEVNFNVTLGNFLASGGVYVGVSAGSIALSKSLPNNLGYINCTLEVHVEEGTKCGHLDTSGCPNIRLTDNQAIIIKDNDIVIME